MIDEGQIKRLAAAKGHTHGRCFIWTGEDADPFEDICSDLPQRLEQYGRTAGGWWLVVLLLKHRQQLDSTPIHSLN